MGTETGKPKRISPFVVLKPLYADGRYYFGMPQQENIALSTHTTYHGRWLLDD